MFVDDVESTHGKVAPVAQDHVQRALARIETLDPEFGKLSKYMRRRVRAAQAKLPHETPRRAAEPPPDEAPAWRLFDVARVLNDL